MATVCIVHFAQAVLGPGNHMVMQLRVRIHCSNGLIDKAVVHVKLGLLFCLPAHVSNPQLARMHLYLQTLHMYAAVGVVVHLSRGETGSTAGIAASTPSPTPKTIS